MRRDRLVAAIITLVAAACSTFVASADHCGEDTTNRNAHDPFGSCEERTGRVHCGAEGAASADAPTVTHVTVGPQGIQLCFDDRHTSFPMRGRASIYNSQGHAGVGADGDETYNTPYMTNGFVRLDFDTATGQICLYGPTVGTWWTEGGGASGAPACMS